MKWFNKKPISDWPVGLKLKVLIILLAIWVLYIVADIFIQQQVIFPSFISLEHSEAQKDIQRCVRAIDREIHHLTALTQDWSSWDDTYQFVKDKNKKFISANLVKSTLDNSNLNILCICDTDGNVVWGELHEQDMKTVRTIETLDAPLFVNMKKLLKHSNVNSSIQGIIGFGEGVMLVGSRPILTSTEEGPSRGTIFIGRYLGKTTIDTLKKQTQVDFEILPLQMERLTPEIESVMQRMNEAPPYIIERANEERLWIYTVKFDIEGSPAFLVKARTPMVITEKGGETIRYALISTALAVFVVMVMMMFLLQRTVVRPISRLTKHILSIATSGDLSARIHLHREDELGALADEFDKMLHHLEIQNTELEMLSIELVDGITKRQEAEAKLKEEIEARKRLAARKEELLHELNKKNKILENLAVTDGLTGLYNHKYIIERLQKEIAEALRYSKPLSIIMMDIDYFKKVNDTYGHQTGDDVLVGVSDGLKETLREGDIAGRYGGEEFMLILTNTDLEGAIAGAERIRQLVGNLKWDIPELAVNISAGVATLKDENASQLIEHADNLLYKAKKGGRNRVES